MKKNEFLKITVQQTKPWKIPWATDDDKKGETHPFTSTGEEIIVQVLFLVTSRTVHKIK